MSSNKGLKIDIILSIIGLLLTIALIILVIFIADKKPKKYPENNLYDKTIIGLESFDFIDDKTIPEYPHDNLGLGLTGKLILDCYTGTCVKEIFHKDIRESCDYDDNVCTKRDYSWTEYKHIIDHDCTKQCYDYGIEKCNCSSQYQKEGTCKRKIGDNYAEGKICYAYNTIYFWKGRKYKILNTASYSYLNNAKLKDEECPQGKKNCGIIDDEENKLCINSNSNCPINYISENKMNGFSSVKFGNKTFYYGNDNSRKDKRIIAGLIADTDFYLNQDKDENDIIDNYTISGFLEENKNLYKEVNLGFDPYKDEDIDKKGKSYLRTYYNEGFDLTNLRKGKEQYYFNRKINNEALNSINKKTKFILILGLIACGYLLLVFIIIIIKQCYYLMNNYDPEENGINLCLFVIFLCLILTPLIFGCINIVKTNKAEDINPQANYNTFRTLNIIFIIIGFILFLFLVCYAIFVPIKLEEKTEIREQETVSDINNHSDNKDNQKNEKPIENININ